MGDDEYIKIFAPLAYRAADKFFKFASWAVLISVIDYAQKTTHSRSLFYLHILAIFFFAVALMLQTMHVIVRSPADWGVPRHLYLASRITQFVAGFALLAVIASPYLILDQVIDELTNLKASSSINSSPKTPDASCPQPASADVHH